MNPPAPPHRPRRAFLAATLLAIAFASFLASTARADLSQPVFPDPISIQNSDSSNYDSADYYWESAAMQGDLRVDSYFDSSNSLYITVTSKPTGAAPSIAHVAGDTWWGESIDGHIANGSFGHNYSYYDDYSGNYSTTQYSVNLHAPTAATVLIWEQWDESSSSNSYGNSNDWSSSWTHTTSAGASTTGNSGSSDWWDDGSGSNTGVATLFGRTFDLTGGGSSYENDSTGLVRSSSSENYSSQDGSASFSIDSSSDNMRTPADIVSVSGWDADIGSFSATVTGTSINLATIAWPARSSPTFGGTHLWLNGVPYTWQSGALSSTGTVTDTYASTSPNALGSLVMSAYVPDFKAGNLPATLSLDGAMIGTLAYDSADGPQMVPGYVAVFSNPSGTHTAPFFSAGSLWLNGTTEYPFEAGYNDAFGGRMDLYVNPNAGSVILSGTTPSSASVGGHSGADFFTGTYSDGDFTLSGDGTLSTQQAISAETPDALWVAGLLYTRTATDVDTYQATAGGSVAGNLAIAIQSDDSFQIDGSDDAGSFTGSIPGGGSCTGWLSTVPPEGSSDDPAPLFAVFLTPTPDGGFELTPPPNAPPAGFPSAISCGTAVYIFLGAVEASSGESEAVYFPREAPASAQRWITVQLSNPSNGRHTARLRQLDAAGALTDGNGTYTPANHLFQTAGVGTGFLPMYAANPLENDSAWLLDRPQAANLPPSFVIRGQPWWFAGYDAAADTASYLGFYDGQIMTLAAADAEGYRIVTLADPLSNGGTSIQGTLSSTRRSVRFRDGTVAFSGDSIGDQAHVAYEDQFALQTVQGDLDIIGNNLSFGVLGNDASLAGSLFQFTGDTSDAVMHSILSASNASWTWWKAAYGGTASLEPVMHLDGGHTLQLYPPGEPPVNPTPAITLDATVGGVSTIRGTLRVRPGGDISMGQFQAGGQP